MAAIATSPATPVAGISSRWIIGKGVDLSLVIGSALAGYVYLLLFAALHVKVSYLWWFWSIGFDGTHIFAMASRTYFDREARQRNATLFYGSLAVFSQWVRCWCWLDRRGCSLCWWASGPTIT